MQNHNTMRCLAALILVLAASPSAISSANEQADRLTPADERAIRATIEAYRAAWLKNDAQGVLKTFTDDAVLLPAHGAPAVVGKAAIEKYWFAPGGPPTVVTRLDITVDQIGGNPGLAFARGLDGVAWTVNEGGSTRRHSHPGTYLDVMKKLADGTWRIHVHMWNDGPEHVE